MEHALVVAGSKAASKLLAVAPVTTLTVVASVGAVCLLGAAIGAIAEELD